MIRQYSKVSPRLVSSRRSASVTSALVAPGPCLAITACIESITASEAILSFFNSSGVLIERIRSSTNSASVDLAVGERALQRLAGIDRQERQLGADAARLDAGLADVLDRLLHGVDRARRIGLLHRRPERIVLALEAFQAVAEIGGLVGRALGVDQHRQVAADSPIASM